MKVKLMLMWLVAIFYIAVSMTVASATGASIDIMVDNHAPYAKKMTINHISTYQECNANIYEADWQKDQNDPFLSLNVTTPYWAKPSNCGVESFHVEVTFSEPIMKEYLAYGTYRHPQVLVEPYSNYLYKSIGILTPKAGSTDNLTWEATLYNNNNDIKTGVYRMSILNAHDLAVPAAHAVAGNQLDIFPATMSKREDQSNWIDYEYNGDNPTDVGDSNVDDSNRKESLDHNHYFVIKEQSPNFYNYDTQTGGQPASGLKCGAQLDAQCGTPDDSAFGIVKGFGDGMTDGTYNYFDDGHMVYYIPEDYKNKSSNNNGVFVKAAVTGFLYFHETGNSKKVILIPWIDPNITNPEANGILYSSNDFAQKYFTFLKYFFLYEYEPYSQTTGSQQNVYACFANLHQVFTLNTSQINVTVKAGQSMCATKLLKLSAYYVGDLTNPTINDMLDRIDPKNQKYAVNPLYALKKYGVNGNPWGTIPKISKVCLKSGIYGLYDENKCRTHVANSTPEALTLGDNDYKIYVSAYHSMNSKYMPYYKNSMTYDYPPDELVISPFQVSYELSKKSDSSKVCVAGGYQLKYGSFAINGLKLGDFALYPPYDSYQLYGGTLPPPWFDMSRSAPIRGNALVEDANPLY